MAELSLHERLHSYYREAFHGYRRRIVASGASLVLLGTVSLLLPLLPIKKIDAGEGSILALSGAAVLISAPIARLQPAFWISMLLGIIGLAAGTHLLAKEFAGSKALCLFFGAYFAAAGIVTGFLAADRSRRHCRHWEWLAVSSAMSLNLAIVTLSGLPQPFSWVVS